MELNFQTLISRALERAYPYAECRQCFIRSIFPSFGMEPQPSVLNGRVPLPSYDLLYIATPKDFNKLRLSFARAQTFLNPRPQSSFVIAPEDPHIEGLQYVHEREVLDIKIPLQVGRPKWFYQQFLKLTQRVTLNDYYFVCDADVLLCRPIELFGPNGSPKLFLGRNQYWRPYFNTMNAVLDLKRSFSHSFICDMMLMNKRIIQEMIPNIQEFIHLVFTLVMQNGENYFSLSEYEIYGNFVMGKYPTVYSAEHLKCIKHKKATTYSDLEIEMIERIHSPLAPHSIVLHTQADIPDE